MEMMNDLPPIFGVLGLVCAIIVFALMARYAEGEEKVRKIAASIHEGAMVFLHREYLMLTLFAVPLFIIIFLTPGLGWKTALSFAVGALSSAAAGYIGMFAATKANVRTTTAAQTSGAGPALKVAFYGGSVMGLCVASLGLLGLAIKISLLSTMRTTTSPSFVSKVMPCVHLPCAINIQSPMLKSSLFLGPIA